MAEEVAGIAEAPKQGNGLEHIITQIVVVVEAGPCEFRYQIQPSGGAPLSVPNDCGVILVNRTGFAGGSNS